MKFLFFPFIALGKLVEGIMKMTGRLVAIMLGFAFLILGIVLSLTFIGAILGIPLAILGFTMIIRGLF
ncbi:hypothetical protein KQI38_11085 [Tissierella carlieri]|jgi:hypothetical protein|uniref:hypothetical protein n=1 Tax=Tissierella TaxID=41273 RepID=UPI001C0FB023|nr:hypothetical protein [Tissierella carlieri]MBU5312577.1 hypothetical protein [Tissierella carlieri]MDU5083400.1 hypothetical protein [Bacillota bacterium]